MREQYKGQEGGLLRLPDVLAPKGPLPISKSSWYAGIASGRYPKQIKIGRISTWSASSIQTLIAQLSDGGAK